MSQHKQKRLRQAAGGLLVMISTMAFLAALVMHVPPHFWSAAGLVFWLVIANAIALSAVGAIALSIIRLIAGAGDQHVH